MTVIATITADIAPAAGADDVPDTVDQIAAALTGAGYAANTREVGTGVQICQHHCPVAHVAAEFPELCGPDPALHRAARHPRPATGDHRQR